MSAENSQTQNLKRYKISDSWKDDISVTLEVDHDKLTQERAEMFLRFWTGAADRIEEEDGNAVRAAIRSFGVDAIYHMLGDLGASFNGGHTATHWSHKIRDNEGFGGEDGTPHGWIGIRIIAAEAQSPSYDEVEIKELSA
ncbi:DUF2528 family protein [Pseudomonas sp. MWU12-2345]|uniref:DUF2528 family protein n=1 Tax=Pseudomonas sp. MWU12-2345 TaxID=2928689 RepID=UPI00200D22BA|nr:DUF2528 family protein [Pseudomonas sp. MWU12-2345]